MNNTILELPKQSPQQIIAERVKEIEGRISEDKDTPEDLKFLNKIYKLRRLK